MTRHELLWAALLVVCVSAAVLYFGAPRATYVRAGQGLPDFALPSLDGVKTQAISGLRGLPLLLVFFDTTSKSAAPQLQEIEIVHSHFVAMTLRVVGVAVDKDTASARRFLDKMGVQFLVLSDPGGVVAREKLRIREFPEAYLLQQSGRVAAVFPGPTRWRTREVEELITSVLPINAPRLH